MPDTTSPHPAAVYLAEVAARVQAATTGPWWSEESSLCWKLQGVHAMVPAQMFPGTSDVMIPEQVLNHQILKAPKQNTPYAEYWPGEEDAEFITRSRTDVPALLHAVRAALDPHQDNGGRCVTCREMCTCVEDALPEGGHMMYAREMHQAVWDAWANCTHGNEPWPCKRVRDIRAALLGETCE